MHVATYGILAQGYYQNSDTFTDGMKTLFVVLGVVMAVVVVGALFRGIGRVMAAPLPAAGVCSARIRAVRPRPRIADDGARAAGRVVPAGPAAIGAADASPRAYRQGSNLTRR